SYVHGTLHPFAPSVANGIHEELLQHQVQLKLCLRREQIFRAEPPNFVRETGQFTKMPVQAEIGFVRNGIEFTISQRPVSADRKIASMTSMLFTASSRGTGGALLSRMARLNQSPCNVYWSHAGISSITRPPPYTSRPSSKISRDSPPGVAL